MPSPGFDQDLGLSERVEDFAVEQFIAQRPIEALAIAIFPWAARAEGLLKMGIVKGRP